jgi:beta-lactam-binding protein with PASTA domain
MKKVIATIALAAVCFGSTAYAFTPVRVMQQDTSKAKVKVKKKGNKVKVKKKVKDTTTHQ